MPKLEIKGLDKIEKALRENVTMNDVKRVVRQNGSQMQKQMQTNADFKRDTKQAQLNAVSNLKSALIVNLL